MSMFSKAFHSIVNAVAKPLGPEIQAAAVGLGTTFGGPIGGTLAGSFAGKLIQDSTNPGSDVPSLPTFPSGPVATSGTAAAGGTMGSAISTVGGVIKNAYGKIIGFLLKDGSKLSLAGAAALAARVGLPVASLAIGVGVEILAQALFQHKHRGRRRHRGISGADIRRTKSTIRKVEHLHHNIAVLARSATHHRAAARRGGATGRGVEVIRTG